MKEHAGEVLLHSFRIAHVLDRTADPTKNRGIAEFDNIAAVFPYTNARASRNQTIPAAPSDCESCWGAKCEGLCYDIVTRRSEQSLSLSHLTYEQGNGKMPSNLLDTELIPTWRRIRGRSRCSSARRRSRRKTLST